MLGLNKNRMVQETGAARISAPVALNNITIHILTEYNYLAYNIIKLLMIYY